MQPVWMRASFAAAVLKVFGGKPSDSRIAIGAGVLFTAESLTHLCVRVVWRRPLRRRACTVCHRNSYCTRLEIQE